MSLLPDVPDWQLVQRVGAGVRTSVYLARPAECSQNIPPDYAIKLLTPPHDNDPISVNLLRREALVGRHICHPHVISTLAARVDQPPYYVVMPRLHGATLESVLGTVGPLPAARGLWIVRQLAEGLDALHKRKWIHGDIKPSNIIVSAQGHVTLIDLGFARHAPNKENMRSLMGTLKYAAPEMFVSSKSQNSASDIYSLGVTLYEILTGRVPFASDNPRELASAHLEQIPLSPRRLVPRLPQSVAVILKQMLAKEPMRRPQNAEELISRLIALEVETFDLQVSG